MSWNLHHKVFFFNREYSRDYCTLQKVAMILNVVVGIRLGPFTFRFFSFVPLIKSACEVTGEVFSEL